MPRDLLNLEDTRMLQWIRCAVWLGTSVVASAAWATDPVAVSQAWARATAVGQDVGAVYMNLESPVDAKLLLVETPLADAAEIHQSSMKDGVMEMRPADCVELPAKTSVSLKPGGYHIMLIGLKQPLKVGDKLPMTLTFKQGEQSSQRQLEVAVQMSADEDAHAQHHHH